MLRLEAEPRSAETASMARVKASSTGGRGRPSRSRVLHPLLRHAAARRSEGMILPFVILAVLVMAVGSLAIANRSSLGTLGTVYQSLSFDAQEAAETGMNRIISELNRPRNRGLLRSKGTSVDSSALWTGSEAASLHTSRCPGTGAPDLASNPSIGYPASGSAAVYSTVYLHNDGSVSTSASSNASGSASAASRAYRLVSVTRRPESELTIFQAMSAPAGTVTLEVEGRALNASGATTAVTTLRKVFQLVPKCCGTSFGGVHGNVDYRRPASASSAYVCLRDNMLGLGLVGGTGSSTGTFTLSGSISVNTASTPPVPISTVYCLADTSGTCTITDNSKDTSVDLINPRPSNFPVARTYPGGSTTDPAPGVLQKPSPATSSTSAFLYCIDNTNQCRQWAVNADAAAVPANCTQSSTETHCYYASLDYKGDDVYFLTNSRKLRLYFVSSGKIMDGSGNSGIHHCKTLSSGNSPTCSGTRPSTADLAIFGCNSCGVQSYDWKGTPDVLNAFIYIPNGDASLAGDASFQGVLWTNKISSVGNVSWVVPGSGLQDVMELMGLLAARGSSPTANPLLFDYVARATSSFRWINP